ncbi:MAG: metallophosphoesterase [Oligosphaeraceae bacterium]
MRLSAPAYHEVPFPVEEVVASLRQSPALPERPWTQNTPAEEAPLVEFAGEPRGPVFFLGDVHGDRMALEGVLAAIRSLAPQGGRIVVLGDVVDRGEDSLACLLRLRQGMEDARFPVTLLLGDHEEALSWREEQGGLVSSVTCSNFARELREIPGAREWGSALVAWLQRQPRLLFLPSGLFAAHGGVPQQDLLPRLTSRQSLSEPQILQDFLWNRLTDARRKRPSRGSRGMDFGRENLLEFCRQAGSFLDAPPRLLLCGHQHPFAGWQWVPAGENAQAPEAAALCLHTSFQRVPIPGENPLGTPCFARYLPGNCRKEGEEALTVYGLLPPPESLWPALRHEEDREGGRP